MKFSIEDAKRGMKVTTRVGQDVTILAYDINDVNDKPIVAVVNLPKIDKQVVIQYHADGRLGSTDNDCDLIIVPKKVVGYICIYSHDFCDNRIFSSEEEARLHADLEGLIAIKKIEFDEV